MIEHPDVNYDYPSSPARIVCAACMHKDTGHVILGARHFDRWMAEQLDAIGECGANYAEHQGFIDQHHRFYDRKEAME